MSKTEKLMPKEIDMEKKKHKTDMNNKNLNKNKMVTNKIHRFIQ